MCQHMQYSLVSSSPERIQHTLFRQSPPPPSLRMPPMPAIPAMPAAGAQTDWGGRGQCKSAATACRLETRCKASRPISTPRGFRSQVTLLAPCLLSHLLPLRRLRRQALATSLPLPCAFCVMCQEGEGDRKVFIFLGTRAGHEGARIGRN